MRRRGFTLVEVAISSALTVALTIVVLAWVRSVASVAGEAPEHQATRRTALAVQSQFALDLERSGSCDAQRLGSSVHSISTNHLSFWSDVDGDRDRDLVRWEVSEGELVRSVEPGGGGCTTTGEAVPKVVARGVRSGEAGKFVAVRDGADVVLGSTQSCTSVPDPCRYGAVRMRLVLDDGAGPVVVLHTARLPE
jgi:hypothetical protein